MKILVADDDPQLVRALRITLAARGYDVLTAADGEEALAVAIERSPDLIMLDPNTPWQVDGDRMAALAGNTPFDKLPVQGRVRQMMKGGKVL